MKLKKYLLAGILLSVLLFPVKITNSLAGLFSYPEVTVTSVKLNSVGIKTIDLTVFLNINNPNKLGVELKKVEYKVDINKIENVSEGITKKEIKIAHETKDNLVEIPVSINNKKVLPTLASIAKSPEVIEYTVNGKVYFGTIIGDIPIPFTKKSNIDNTGRIENLKKQIKALNFFGF